MLPSAAKRRAESAPPRPNPKSASSRTRYAPGAIDVAAGIWKVRASSSSLKKNPPTSTGSTPLLTSSTQSPGSPPLDSTSLIRTAAEQSLAAPRVEDVVVVKSPVPSGQRPYVVAACVTHV